MKKTTKNRVLFVVETEGHAVHYRKGMGMMAQTGTTEILIAKEWFTYLFNLIKNCY